MEELEHRRMTVREKQALGGMTEQEKEKALEILKIVNGIEVSRADKILEFCKITAEKTAITDTKGLFFS